VSRTRSVEPRICMPSWRNISRRAHRCAFYEAEDVLAEIDDVDLICPDMGWGARVDEYWLRTPLYHDVTRKLVFANPGLRKVRLERHYDLLIAGFRTLWDVPYINAIQGWRDHCKISACWIGELWAAAVPDHKYWLPALTQFDFVFLEFRDTVAALSNAINRPCYWLPGAVDALRFSPLPRPPLRTIDMYSIGRRHEGIHREMLEAAERRGLLYAHDTFANLAMNEVHDYREHRNLVANLAKRSRFFMVASAKADAPDQRQGQVDVGHRYYEGAAAGAALIGEAPASGAYRELFPWQEAVIEVRPDGSDILAVLDDLHSDPSRLAAISARNTREALLRHDWVYRWDTLFKIAGIQPSPGSGARMQRLKDLAELAGSAEQSERFNRATEDA